MIRSAYLQDGKQASYLILDCFLCFVYFYGRDGCFAYDLSFLAYMYLGNFYNNHWFRYMHFPARLHQLSK